MLSKLDKRFVPRLKKHILSDLLKAYPGGTKPAAPTSTTPKSHSQTQEDINADAAASTASESHQASASEATYGADATAAAAAISAAASQQVSTSDTTCGANGSSDVNPSPTCGDSGSLLHERRQQHLPDQGAADSRKRRFSHISGGDFRKGYRGCQQTSPPDPTAQPEASTSHAETCVPGGSADSHHNKGPPAFGQARPNLQSQSQHGVTRPQAWTDEDVGLNVPDEEPAAEVQSSMLDLWVNLSILVMSSYNLLLSCCKTAAAYGKIGTVYLWGLALGILPCAFACNSGSLLRSHLLLHRACAPCCAANWSH